MVIYISEVGINCVNAWYSEISMYDFKNPGWSESVGHFTQVVWNASTKLGIGLALSSDGWLYCVGQYFEAGNYEDLFAENVFPTK